VGGRAGRRFGDLTAALLLLAPATARAQVPPNRATLYLHPTDATDARAVWVNPAGLRRFEVASVHADLTVGDPGTAGRLRQLTLGFSSRGFAFAYERDVFATGRGHTYRFGLGSSHGRLAAGLAAAMYRGGTSARGWDLGLVYDLAPSLSVGGVVANIGRPAVRGSVQPVTYVPGATLRLFDSRAALSAHGRMTSDGVLAYAFGMRAGLRERFRVPLRLTARIDTDRSLRSRGFAFGLSVGADDLVGTVATTPGDVGRVEALSLYGVATRRFGR
jgi:hypothetical protein